MSEQTPPRPRRGTNPVLRRELLERWRGGRATWILTGYVATLTVVMLLLLWAGSSWADDQGRFGVAGDPGPVIGRFLFDNVLAIVLLLVLFVGPGYAAAQVAQERERRTLGLLQITLVTPWRIVVGKLGAAAAWLLLLVLTAAPMAAVAFFLGGVELDQLLRSVAYLLVLTVAVAAIGIGISSVVRRTVAAVVLTYAVVLALVVGTGFAALIEVAVRRGDVDQPVALFVNPFTGLADAAEAPRSFDLPSVLTPFAHVVGHGDAFPGRGGVRIDPGVPRPMPMPEPPMPMPEPRFGAADGEVGVAVEDSFLPLAPEPETLFAQVEEGPPDSWTWVWIALGYAAAAVAALGVAASAVRPGHGPRGART